MPITGLQLITVTGKFLYLDGSPASGSVSFTPTATLINSVANEIVVPKKFTALLNGSGAISVVIPATNDPDLAPTDSTYTVTESIAGASDRTYSVVIPYDASGATIDLADIAPVASGGGGGTSGGNIAAHEGAADPHPVYVKDSERDVNVGFVGLAANQGTRDGTKFLRDDGTWQTVAASGSGVTIRDEGAPLTVRPFLNFTGDSVTASDDSLDNETAVVINHLDTAVHTVAQPTAAHALTDTTKHTASGLVVGRFLRATSATGFDFQDLDYGTTTELADVSGGTESEGVSTKLSRADHAHFHGDLSATLPNAHHNKNHADTDHTGPTRHDVSIGGSLVGTRVRTNLIEGDAVRITGVDVATGSGQTDITVTSVPWVVTLNTIAGSGGTTPAALQEGIGNTANSARRTTVDLTNGRNWRMTSVIQIDGPAGAKFAIQWSADGTTWRFLDDTLSNALNTVQSPTPAATAYASIDGAIGTKTVTTWLSIPTAARADVHLRVVTFDGDGVGVGSVGLVTLQVK